MTITSRLLWAGVMALVLPESGVASPKIAGHWEGAVTRDGSVQFIAIDFKEVSGEAGATMQATIDIPELGMFYEPLREVRQEDGKLHIRFIYGRFDCVIHEDVSEITGGNRDWGPPLRIHLKRLAGLRNGLHQEEVGFRSGSVSLAGTLIRPEGTHAVPAVVCVHGSEQPTRESWEYRGMAFALARSGFAALVYDRRGNGASSGTASDATFDDLAEDAVAAVEYLKSRKDLSGAKVGVFGASQGGWIGPLAASKSDDISFVIAHAGPAVTVWEQERHRIEFGMKADGFTSDEIRAALSLSDQIFDYARTGQGWQPLSEAVRDARKAKWAEYVQLPESPEDAMSWRQQQYDPAAVLRTLKVPILALFGANDTMVPPEKNVARLEAYLSEAGNQDVTIRVFADVGHGMELSKALKGGDWKWPTGYWIWPRKASGYYETIMTWIDRRANTPG